MTGQTTGTRPAAGGRVQRRLDSKFGRPVVKLDSLEDEGRGIVYTRPDCGMVRDYCLVFL